MSKAFRTITILIVSISLLFLISSCSSTEANNENVAPNTNSQPSEQQLEEMKERAFLGVIDSMFIDIKPEDEAEKAARKWMIADMKERLTKTRAYKKDQSEWRDIIQEEMYIQVIRAATLDSEPSIYIGEAFDYFFSNPVWETFVGTRSNSNEDVRIVEFRGGCLEDDTPVNALIQFELDDDLNFTESYFSIDDRGRSILELQAFIERVIEVYKIESNKATPAN